MSFPLCSVDFLISMPCAAKKPFWIPRSSGSAFAIGSVFTVMVVTVALGAPVAAPPSAAATRTTGIAATTSRLRNGLRLSVIDSSLSNRHGSGRAVSTPACADETSLYDVSAVVSLA